MPKEIRGTTRLHDDDGNFFDVQFQSIRGSDRGFTKVWLDSFMDKLDVIGNQKLKVAFWLIRHADRGTNLIDYSLRQIAEKSGIGLSTVIRTIDALQETDFIRRVNKSYMLNPDVLYKNFSAHARRTALMKYLTEGDIEPDIPPEKREIRLSGAINAMHKKEQKLQKQMDALHMEIMEKCMEIESIQKEKNNP